MDNFSNRLKEALIVNNMKPIDLSKKTGIGKSSISDWLSGRYEAKQDKVFILSKALNVNEGWLMGLDVPRNKEQSISTIYNKLEESRKNKVYNFAKQQLEEQNKINEFPLSKEIDTLAAHSADPEKVYTDEDLKDIHSYLDKLDDEYDSKHKK